MFGDIGWAELVLIGIVALIVIGPEDLPDMFRQLGRFTAKLRQMSREFSRAMEQAARDSGVSDVANDIRGATSAKSMGLDKVREAADRFEKWDPMKAATQRAQTVAPKPAEAAAPEAAAPAAEVPARALGPETQAQADRQAERKAIIAETAERLKAVSATDAPSAAAEPAPRPVKRAVTRKAAPKPDFAPATPPKPRAPRKKKTDEA
ncbi:MAG: Sec-independent protein translocase protein TatB [Paracoccaceae bacterium]